MFTIWVLSSRWTMLMKRCSRQLLETFLESNQLDAGMLNTLLIQNEIEPVRELELPNGGYVEVYALTGAEMDSLQRDKNYNNGANQTIVDYDNSNQDIYLVGIGGNSSIREVEVKCGSDGFMYTVWTNNSPKFYKHAAKSSRIFQ